MFDRVLLVLLLLLLPLGIVVSRVVTGEMTIGKSSTIAEQEKKIEAMMNKLNQGVTTTAPVSGDFTMTGVIYASDSGILKMAGMAPQASTFIWVWIAGTGIKPVKSDVPASGSAVKPVEWNGPIVVRPSNGGVFAVEVEIKQYTGVVEIRLEQEKSSTTIKYDVDKRIQIMN